MPRKNDTKIPQKLIEKAVRRHLEGGELGVDLAKEYKVSSSTFYLWLKNYKKAFLKRSMDSEMKPRDIATVDKNQLLAEIQALKAENRMLRNKITDLLIKCGEI